VQGQEKNDFRHEVVQLRSFRTFIFNWVNSTTRSINAPESRYVLFYTPATAWPGRLKQETLGLGRIGTRWIQLRETLITTLMAL
jgi:hypothetical protein